jgi:hypothetical protein
MPVSSFAITSRAAHDVGLSAWFGGTLANAVALNAASAQVDDAHQAGRVANAGWDRWTPVNAAAIGAHLLGSVGQLLDNRDRIGKQQGVTAMVAAKTGLTAAALAATGWSRLAGKTVSAHGDVPVEGATSPGATTPPAVAKAQKQLDILQWVIPALTGALVVVSAFAGEQQRPGAVAAGLFRK